MLSQFPTFLYFIWMSTWFLQMISNKNLKSGKYHLKINFTLIHNALLYIKPQHYHSFQDFVSDLLKKKTKKTKNILSLNRA